MKEQAIKRMRKFIDICRKNNVGERSFHLYYHNNIYITVADSVRDTHGKGEHIQEFKL